MKGLAPLLAIGLALAMGCHAQVCAGPNLHRTRIGGDAINAHVSLQHKPLKSAPVHLLSRDRTVWVGSTDKNGSFRVKGLRPGTYRLTVEGWGSATIRITPDPPKSPGNEQTLQYSLLLADNECIASVVVMN